MFLHQDMGIGSQIVEIPGKGEFLMETLNEIAKRFECWPFPSHHSLDFYFKAVNTLKSRHCLIFKLNIQVDFEKEERKAA